MKTRLPRWTFYQCYHLNPSELDLTTKEGTGRTLDTKGTDVISIMLCDLLWSVRSPSKVPDLIYNVSRTVLFFPEEKRRRKIVKSK